ncbi:protein-disulfide reductase [Bordetella sp. H567]|nr:protein-disulfide reductase [Bordetella sp. H567]
MPQAAAPGFIRRPCRQPAHWAARLASALVLMLAWLVLALPAAHAEVDFLTPEQAFPFSVTMDGPATVRVDYDVASGYYMYRERFVFSVDPAGTSVLGNPVFPPADVKYDPTFDKNMEVYHKPLSIRVPLQAGGGAFTLKVIGQGCADKGVCYPPMGHTVSLQPAPGGYRITGTGAMDPSAVAALAAASAPDASGTGAPGGFSAAPSIGAALTATGSPPGQDAGAQAGRGGQAAQGQAAAVTSAAGAPTGLTTLANSDDVGLAAAIAGMGWLKTAGVFFLLGALLSLTPCVLPMIPIVSSVIVGAGRGQPATRRQGLALAAAYVLGMSLVYTALGVAAGLSGIGLAAWLQTPWVLAVFAALLAVLALAMFDVFTLQAPTRMQSGLTTWLSRVPGGRGTGAFVMGAVSALIVGPCVAAPLAGALVYISQTRDVVLGAAALFAMAWGMGVPLLIVGGSAGSLLPKAGPWMEGVKRLFGMLLLATAWWMLAPLLPAWTQMAGWALLGLVAAVMLRAFEPLRAGGGTAGMFAKGMGLLLALLAVILLVGAASGGRDVLRPLSHLAANDRAAAAGMPGLPVAGTAGNGAELHFTPVRSVAELDAALAAAGRPALLDFYADWCVSCREMEQFTFTDPAVAARMSRMLLLRADVTANNVDDRALLKRFGLFGPPGILFFNADGNQRADVRVIGFQDARRFAESLDRVVTP